MAKPASLPEIAIHFDDRVKRDGTTLSALFLTAEEMANQVATEEGNYSDVLENPILRDTDVYSIGSGNEDVLDLVNKLEHRTDLPEPLREMMTSLIMGVSCADYMRREAFADLSDDEIKRIEELLPLYVLPKDENGEPYFRGYTVESLDDCVELYFLLSKIDWEKLMDGAKLMALALDIARYHATQLDISTIPFMPGEVIYDEVASFGRIVVGNLGDNIYYDDCALLIDLGGDDVYLNNAGGTSPTGYAGAVVFDLSGDDIYRGRDFAQGCGYGGIGALVDLAGDDHYEARHYSQGTALGGFSFFYEGAGNDTYTGDLGNQCNALFGISVFCEASGDDTYRIQSMGQGFASTLGVALMDEMDGHDTYRAGGKYGFYNPVDSACAQGSAMGMRVWPPTDKLTVYGGIGFLSDAKGNDNYIGLSFVQGASYILGLGMIVDSEGDDFYSGESYVQGSGCHTSAGVQVDKGGNDIYKISNVGGGFSLDRSCGVLLDVSGNDIYYGGHEACGAGVKPYGVGILVDAAGNDSYLRARFGYARYPYAEHAQSVGVFLDFEGDDYYQRNKRENNSSWEDGTYGFGIDFAEPPEADFRTKWWNPDSEMPADWTPPAERLKSIHLYDRFHAIGEVIASEDPFSIISEVIKRPERYVSWNHEFIVKDIHDIIEILRLDGRIAPRDELSIADFLNSFNMNLRLAATSYFSKASSEDDSIVESLVKVAERDDDYRVRAMAVNCLGKTGISDLSVAIMEILADDEQWSVRRAAAIALGDIGYSNDTKSALANALHDDPAFQVRTQAAKSLAKISGIDANPDLMRALLDQSGFVRIEAAMGLVEYAEDTRGIDAIINLMDGWPDIRYILDSRAIPLLKEITGQDLKGKEAWDEWWSDVKYDFNLHNALANRKPGQ